MDSPNPSSSVKPVPGLDRVKSALLGTAKGFVAGLGVGFATALLGAPVGTLGGTVLAAAIFGGDTGQIIAVNGGMDSAIAMMAGSAAKASDGTVI